MTWSRWLFAIVGWRAGLRKGGDDPGEDDGEVKVVARRVVLVLLSCAAVSAVSGSVLRKRTREEVRECRGQA